MRYAAVAGILGLVLCASCATVSGSNAASCRTYMADMATTIKAVGEALDAARLNVEEEQWMVPNARYEISAYEQARVFNSAEGMVQTAHMLITVESTESGLTVVRLDEREERMPAMASSAGSSPNYRRNFFEQLDARLERAP